MATRFGFFFFSFSNRLLLFNLNGVIKYATKGGVHEGHADTTSLPIILLVELKELTGSVRWENAVVDVQSRLEGDESGVVLEMRECIAWREVTQGGKWEGGRKDVRKEGRKER